MMKNISDVNNIITPNYADCVLEIELRVERKKKNKSKQRTMQIYVRKVNRTHAFLNDRLR